MEHPFLDVNEIKELPLDEIQKKTSEILSKLQFAHRSGNSALINQLQMAFETYNRAYMEVLKEKFDSEGGKLTGKIDIK